MIRFSVRRPIAISMLIGVLVVMGLVSLQKLGLDLLPELSFPSVSVVTTYPGVSPEDIEEMITKPVEEAVATVSGVKKLTSMSMEGLSVVTVEFNWGKNLDFAAQDIRDKLGLIEGYLPEDASKPLVVKFDISMMPIMEGYASYRGMSPEDVRKFVKDHVKPRLERIDGVASVTVSGGREKEIWVEIDRGKLENFGLSLQDVVTFLQLHNLNLPAGHIVEGSKEYLLRAVGEFKEPSDINDVAVGYTKTGTPVFVRDVGRVIETLSERRNYVTQDGKETVFFDVYKQSGTNTVKVLNKVNEELKRIKADFPDFEPVVVSDQAKFIKRATGRTTNNALVGALLAALMIFFFLRNWRPTLVAALAIPLSVIITFIVIYFAGYTLNIMTLGGIALGVGMLVDNAVVVIENIFRHLEEGEDKMKAAINGTREVGTAISASTFTNIIVFLPVIFVGGIVAKVTHELAVTVAATLLASLFVAVTIIPALARVFFKERTKEAYVKAFGEVWFNPVRRFYERILRSVLRHRLFAVSAAVILFVVSILLIPKVGVEFMPQIDRDFGMIRVTLPPGTDLDETLNYMLQLEDIAKRDPDVKIVGSIMGELQEAELASFMGGTGVNSGMLYVVFVDKKFRNRPSYETINEIVAKAPSYKDAKVEVLDISKMAFLGFGEKPINIKIYGKDLNTLKELAMRIKDRIEDTPGLVSPSISLEEAKPEILIKIDRKKAAYYGLTPVQVETELQAGLLGKVATRIRIKGEEINTRVKLEEDQTEFIEDIKSLSIKTPLGTRVPLKEIANISYGLGPIRIDRENQVRTVAVGANAAGRTTGEVIRDLKKKLAGFALPPGYTMAFKGEWENIQDMLKSMAFAIMAAVLLIYMVMAAQFESFKDPFIVMFTMPLAIIGVVFFFLVTRTSISLPSLMGTLILVGIVVNNAIVMIDYIKKLRGRGLPGLEAVVKGAQVRLRPILITSLTTILGMVPMALSRSEGSEMRAPMAIAVIGGLLTSTFLTLFVIPTLYTFFERIKTKE